MCVSCREIYMTSAVQVSNRHLICAGLPTILMTQAPTNQVDGLLFSWHMAAQN